jgi:hypothetical protein
MEIQYLWDFKVEKPIAFEFWGDKNSMEITLKGVQFCLKYHIYSPIVLTWYVLC